MYIYIYMCVCVCVCVYNLKSMKKLLLYEIFSALLSKGGIPMSDVYYC